jgi:large subunit ribosomal protein L18
MPKRTPQAARTRRHASIRKRLAGTPARPRLAVFRSNQHIYAQVIDDEAGRTLVSASDVEASLREGASGTKVSRAVAVGTLIGQRAKQAGLSAVVFDRGGFAYRGRVKALAEAAREEGLEF